MKKIRIIDGNNTGEYYPADEVDKELTRLQAVADAAREQAERVSDAIKQITDWRDKAYPLDIFPEPDFKNVRELLGDNLITLVSASNMRHVTTRVCEILTAAPKGLNE